MAAVPHWSVEEYERMVESGLVPKRAELIRGIIVERPQRTPVHVDLSKWIYDHFYEHLLPGYEVYQRAPLRLADSEPEPDITVISEARTSRRTEHPTTALLAITIVTARTPLDREYPLLCAEADIPEYWIVLAETLQIEVRRQPVNGKYHERRFYNLDETLVCLSVPNLSLVLNELFE